jgi:mannonate dehydratase
MKMTFRWYGSAIDPIPLKYVKQIPGMTGLMGLLDKPAGVDWPEEEFAALKKEVNDAGLEIEDFSKEVIGQRKRQISSAFFSCE